MTQNGVVCQSGPALLFFIFRFEYSDFGPEQLPGLSRNGPHLAVGLLVQLVDCCTGIAEARVRISYKSEFFSDFFSQLHWKVATINNFDHLLYIISSPRSSYIQFSYWVFIGSTFSYRLVARSLGTCSSMVERSGLVIKCHRFESWWGNSIFIPSSLCHWRKKRAEPRQC